MEPSEDIIDIKNVLQLLNLADDKSSTESSPRPNRRGSTVKGSVKKTLESARDLFANLVKNPTNEEEKRRSVPVVINCIVKVLTDIVEKIATQEVLIKKKDSKILKMIKLEEKSYLMYFRKDIRSSRQSLDRKKMI